MTQDQARGVISLLEKVLNGLCDEFEGAPSVTVGGPKERIGWINVMRDIQEGADPRYRYCGRVWETEGKAREMVSDGHTVATIEIRWSE